MKASRQTIGVLARELARHGVEEWSIDRRHHHPRLRFEWCGREVFYVLASSGSDWRGTLNARSSLRRVLRERRPG
jgi:hypothetical protein